METSSGLADEEVMQLVAAGDPRAFELLYDRHGGAAFSLAYRMVGNRWPPRTWPRRRSCRSGAAVCATSPQARQRADLGARASCTTARSTPCGARCPRAPACERRGHRGAPGGRRADRRRGRAPRGGPRPCARALDALPEEQCRVIELALLRRLQPQPDRRDARDAGWHGERPDAARPREAAEPARGGGDRDARPARPRRAAMRPPTCSARSTDLERQALREPPRGLRGTAATSWSGSGRRPTLCRARSPRSAPPTAQALADGGGRADTRRCRSPRRARRAARAASATSLPIAGRPRPGAPGSAPLPLASGSRRRGLGRCSPARTRATLSAPVDRRRVPSLPGPAWPCPSDEARGRSCACTACPRCRTACLYQVWVQRGGEDVARSLFSVDPRAPAPRRCPRPRARRCRAGHARAGGRAARRASGPWWAVELSRGTILRGDGVLLPPPRPGDGRLVLQLRPARSARTA